MVPFLTMLPTYVGPKPGSIPLLLCALFSFKVSATLFELKAIY
jgi:hypothetical protein